jgi:hypothetical protein
MARQRLDVTAAALALGISSDAVRKRVKRGTLPSEKDADGSLYVWVDADPPDDHTPTQAHLDSLHDQIAFLRAELERKDHLLAAALERIPPALEEPPREARETPETASDEAHKEAAPPTEEEHQSWWKRMFGK